MSYVKRKDEDIQIKDTNKHYSDNYFEVFACARACASQIIAREGSSFDTGSSCSCPSKAFTGKIRLPILKTGS